VKRLKRSTESCYCRGKEESVRDIVPWEEESVRDIEVPKQESQECEV